MFNLIKWIILTVIVKSIKFDLEEELRLYSQYEVVYYIFKTRIILLTKDMVVLRDVPFLKEPFSYRRKMYFSNKEVHDIVRCMIVFENEEDIGQFVEILKKYFWIKREKNHYNSDERYKVYQMLVSLKLLPEFNIEIQLMLKNLYDVTMNTHYIYKILRLLIILKDNYFNPEFSQLMIFDRQTMFIPLHLLYELENRELSLFEVFIHEINYHIKDNEMLSQLFIRYTPSSFDNLNSLISSVQSYLHSLYSDHYNK
jgi:hypothetical protein